MLAFIKNCVSLDELSALRTMYGVVVTTDDWVVRLQPHTTGLPRRIGERILAKIGNKLSMAQPHIATGDADTFMFSSALPNTTSNQAWHRDTVSDSVVLFVPLEDINETNGCCEILPGSVNTPVNRWKRHWNTVVRGTARASSAIAMDGRLLHRRTKNTTDTVRRVLVIEITPSVGTV